MKAVQHRTNLLSRLAQTPPTGAAPSTDQTFSSQDVMSDVYESVAIGGLGGALAGVVAAMVMKNPATILFGVVGAAIGAAAYGGWTYQQDAAFMTTANAVGANPATPPAASPTGM
jgi:uncharacterized membrane protein YeaQ/YmgE (transglycosylase-associated protein family)